MQYVDFAKNRKRIKGEKEFQLNQFLREIQGIMLDRNSHSAFRINLMRIEKGKLKVIKHIGMDNAIDINIAFTPGKGCAGIAYQRGETMIGDTRAFSPTQWGLTPEQASLTENIMSILSIPLRFEGKTIAVLNIDSTDFLENLGFDDKNFIEKLEVKSNAIADFLEFFYF